ncbi:MAG: hypothetical protein U5L96_08725 [Owenweeksia sp.]|nr:hypothetical protein [Owenweeksia sp.]
MLRKLLLKHTDRYLARWVIFVFDLVSVVLCYFLAALMRFNFDFSDMDQSGAATKVGLVSFFI